MSARLSHPDQFLRRHIGPDEAEVTAMLEALGIASLEELTQLTVPASIRLARPLKLPEARTEHEMLADLEILAAKNSSARSFLGMGYQDCFVPPVILRNILLNPGWYTQYTPYQAEIAQGRLEALLNFQTMITDLTGLEVANASLLDEATAAAEAMSMLWSVQGHPESAFFVAENCHPQNIEVVRTRARPLGIRVVVGDPQKLDFKDKVFGLLLQYPATDGLVADNRDLCSRAHAAGALVAVAADILALTLLTPPGEWGADVALGSAQRFGVPLGYGGPHAAYFATRSQYTRVMPGRLIGVSKDAQGNPALRMALQTREQHIRREKATSNICTAQVLLAVMSSMYAVYHGPSGLKAIATRVRRLAVALSRGLERAGFTLKHRQFFDTLCVEGRPEQIKTALANADARAINLRRLDDRSLGIALDETTGPTDVEMLLSILSGSKAPAASAEDLAREPVPPFAAGLERKTAFLTHPVFNTHHSETEMQRYMRRLESRDLSLTHSMIPLGSCTMKLNAAAEMTPVTWPKFSGVHPFAPVNQAAGYQEVFRQLEQMLGEITGFEAVSLQPNAGSQGEYAGLLVIRAYHESRGQKSRNVCLIPSSAHGTNPASAAMAGMQVVVVRCDENGNIDVADLAARAAEHKDRLAACMVTYPSTHGVFEEEIRKICSVVHEYGGQVYMDGANMNAQVGLCRPADIGADVCHLNLHKTFCIPHGGGGPGMGPIGVSPHLAPFLPRHPVVATGGSQGIGPIAAAPWGSANVLLISWAYIVMMGSTGLKEATQVAILNANYVAHRLAPHYPVLYRGSQGRIAHECILDLRPLKAVGIEAEDVAKRLMDYGFHAPTLSFPVSGTLMVEPTESESKGELDRFCDAMIAIREEIRAVETGRWSREDNPLKHAPHTAAVVTATEWKRAYSREVAAFPSADSRASKFWPSVGRLNAVLGDRHLVCTCPPIEDYAGALKSAAN